MEETTGLDVQTPLPGTLAWPAIARSTATTARLLATRRLHLPRARVGRELGFADGATTRVFRETVVDGPPPREPCVLVVAFRLRAVRGRGHALFRVESILNTPLFAGFPGLRSKLWLDADQQDTYRGFYEWDGADRARAYARSLWRVLALVSVPGSIHYRVLPGLRRDDVLADPARVPGTGRQWWRPVPAAADASAERGA